MTEYAQLYVSGPGIPSTLAIKAKSNERLGALLQVVKDSIPDENCANLKLYHINSGRWLPTGEDDTVFSFDLMAGGRLDLRSPLRIARIRFLDDACKTVKVDETKPVSEIVQDICCQLEVQNSEELSLVVAGDYEAPGQAGRKSTSGSPFGSLRGRPASFAFDSATLSRASNSGGNSQPTSPAAATTPTLGRRLTLGRGSSPSALSPDRGSPILSPGSHSPSARRKPFSPSAMSGGKKESPLLDVKRSHTFSSGIKDSPVTMRATAIKAAIKVAKARKHFSKKHGLRLNTPWLAPDLSLYDQGVSEEDELILMYRHFYWTSLEKGTRRVDLLFTQAKVLFLSGEINCSDIKAAQFAAILCQCQHGDYNQEKFTIEWLQKQWHTFLPAKYKAKDAMAQQVLQEHKSLVSVTSSEAKCLLVQLWSTTPTFGYEFFSCAEVRTEKRGLIGISKTKVVFIPHDAKGDEKKSTKFDLGKLESWSHSSLTEVLRLTFPKSTLQLLVPEYSVVLADSLQDHKKLRDVFKSVPGGLDAEYSLLKVDDDSLSPTASRLQLAIPQVHMERDKSLTFDDVYWTEKIGNPLVSEQESQNIGNEGLWHNPVYDRMEELVDERFDFLNDIGDEDDDDDVGAGDVLSPLAMENKRRRPSRNSQAAASGPIGGILGAPVQAPLSSQVTSFTSSNDTTSSTTDTPKEVSTTPKTKKKKKKEKGVTKKKDPLTLGEMLSEFGVKDTYSGSDDDGDEAFSAPSGKRTPSIVISQPVLHGTDNGDIPVETGNSVAGIATSSGAGEDLADALWG